MTKAEYEAQKLQANTGIEWRPVAIDDANELYLISEDAKIYSIARHKVLSIRKYKNCPTEYVGLCVNGRQLYQIKELMIKTFPEKFPDDPSDNWKTIEVNGEATPYEVSFKGQVRRKNNHRVLKPDANSCGYLVIRFRHKGKTITEYLHRLVAAAFIPNPNRYEMVNHIDENKTNDCADNLEWCDRSYNWQYSCGRRKAMI
jgi:hypothetical protein